jgi:tRNA pseudouridine38-40 synthase
MRIALGVEYDGSRFCGWQVQQPGIRTVQGELEAALSRVANHPVRVTCAGRTDTGVHALSQIMHFDTSAQREARNWLLGCNSYLPEDVNLLWAREVPADFSARFSAQSRHYHYWILNRSVRSSLLARRVTWIHRPLDVGRMRGAAQALIGEHDFSSYRALGCQAKSPVRMLHQLHVRRYDDLICLHLQANAFLHHMVRNIAGVLIAIGAGEQPVTWAGEVLRKRDRTQGGVTAPPDGLYFSRVEYPEVFQIPSTPSTHHDWLGGALLSG